MAERRVPYPTTGRFDYTGWVKSNVRSGDVVIFPDNAVYWTESVRLLGAPPHKVLGNGSTLLSKWAPTTYEAPPPFEISYGCSGIEIYDLLIKGPRLAGEGYNSAYEGQHGFAIRGATNIILCRCGSEGVWGDHFYVGGGARNVIIYAAKSPTQSGRHGVAVTSAEDVIVYGGEINALRTLFNFEVHPDKYARRVKMIGVKGTWTLRAITGTGAGEASDIEFHNIIADGTRKLAIEVYGTGQPGSRPYGPRNNWEINGITGFIPVSPTLLTPTPPEGARVYVKLHYINGLTFLNVNNAGIVSTTGTTYP